MYDIFMIFSRNMKKILKCRKKSLRVLNDLEMNVIMKNSIIRLQRVRQQ